MPLLARLLIKTSMLYFLAGFLLGAAMLADKWLGPHGWLWAFLPIHAHLLLVGWMTQFIIGVAWWMFPRYSKDAPRGDERLAWAIYIALNGGLLLRVVAEPAQTLGATGWPGPVLGLSALLQALAGTLFVVTAWGRVRSLSAGRN